MSTDRKRAASPLSMRYLTTWAILASAALAYLALLVANPELAERLLPTASTIASDDVRLKKALTKAVADIEDLQQRIARQDREIGTLRTALAEAEQRQLTTTARLGALESRPPLATAPETAKIAAPAPGPQGADNGPRIVGVVEERPTKAAREGRPQPGLAAAPPPPATLPQSQSGIQLASGPSLDALRLSWQLIQETNKTSLRALEPRVIEGAGDPPSYKLIAGPLASDAEAEKLCERLRQRRLTCSVQPFLGKPL